MSRPIDRLKALCASVRAHPASPHQPADAKLEAYLEKVARRAYAVTDDDVAALSKAGRSQDEIFERTVVAALEAAIERFDAGLRALDEAEKTTKVAGK